VGNAGAAEFFVYEEFYTKKDADAVDMWDSSSDSLDEVASCIGEVHICPAFSSY
jgi:hypothetical protein